MSGRISNFKEFWPFYLGEHALAATRKFHFVGTTIAMILTGYGLFTGKLWLVPLSLLPGYGFAWYSHFFIEKNKPASFSYPLWSFRADFKLWFLMATGKIDQEVERHIKR